MDYEKIFEDLRLRSISLLKRQEQLKWNPSSFFERLMVESELNECRYELLRFTCPKSHLPTDILFLKSLSLSDPPIPDKHLRHKFCECISKTEKRDNEEKMKVLLDSISLSTSSTSSDESKWIPEHISEVDQSYDSSKGPLRDTPLMVVHCLPPPRTGSQVAHDPDDSNHAFKDTSDNTTLSPDQVVLPSECTILTSDCLTTLGSCDQSRSSLSGFEKPVDNGNSDAGMTAHVDGSSKKRNRRQHQKERARAYRAGKVAHFDWVEEVDASRPLNSETATSIVDIFTAARQTSSERSSQGHSDVNQIWERRNDAKDRDSDRRIRFVDYAVRHLGVPDPPDGSHDPFLLVRLLV